MVRELTFRPPAARSFAGCRTYAERRLFALFRGVIPGAERADFALRHCPACDLLFLDPRPSPAETAAKYAALAAFGSTSKEYARAPVRRHAERAARIAAFVRPHLSPGDGRPRRVLDWGGQFGRNLAGFPAPEFERLIVDFERVCDLPDVRHAGSDLAAVEPASCSLLLANHLVEHLAEPLEGLRLSASRLAPGGILHVEVPLGAFREAWAIAEPLTHLNFFSEKSLHSLLERSGLAVLSLETRFQWVTVGAQWCLNAVARAEGSAMRHRPRRPPRDVAGTRHRLALYPRLLLHKLTGR